MPVNRSRVNAQTFRFETVRGDNRRFAFEQIRDSNSKSFAIRFAEIVHAKIATAISPLCLYDS